MNMYYYKLALYLGLPKNIIMRGCKILIALLLIFVCISINAQTREISYLKKKVDAATNNDEKLAAIVSYCEDYSNLQHDSLEKYAYIALELATKTNNERLKNLAQLTLAQDYMQWGWTDSTHVIIDNELPKNLITDNSKRDIYFRLKKLKAIAFSAEGRYKECLEVLYPLEVEAEKYKDSLYAASACIMICNIANLRNELTDAHKWIDRAFLFSSGTQKKFLGSAYISRAQLFYKENKTDSAISFLNKGIAFCKDIEMYDRLATGYRFQAAVYTGLNNIDEAEAALRNMQEARRKINNSPDAFINDNLQIAELYANSGQLKKAIAFCWSKLDSGDYHHKAPGDTNRTFNTDPAVRLPFFEALAGYLKQDKNYSDYQKVLEEIIRLKDTMYEINKADAIAELQTKYDVEQKENTIISQQLKLTQRNYLLYGSLAFIIMAGLITWLWLKNERIKQKVKMQQAIENEKRQAAQSILDAEEKERKRIAADLHDNIGAYASAISADVENIYEKGFTGTELQNLQLHSKEIISSLRDTIWVLNKDNITITGISDRIKNYVNKLKPSYDQINIAVEESIENDVRVGSQKALNIFRIVQEAVHNALKHSGAKEIIVSINSVEKILIHIADDGKGISKNINDGNGLRNMKARAEDVGLKIFLNTSDNGTDILIETTTN